MRSVCPALDSVFEVVTLKNVTLIEKGGRPTFANTSSDLFRDPGISRRMRNENLMIYDFLVHSEKRSRYVKIDWRRLYYTIHILLQRRSSISSRRNLAHCLSNNFL